MAQRGASNSGVNNGGNRNNSGNNNNNDGGNRFVNLEIVDRFQVDGSSNPFYLSNSDHSCLNLVSTQLVGNNYNSWSRAMIMALVAKNKFCFVDGTISRRSVNDSLYVLWSRCNSMVMSWILHVVSKEIADSIMYIDNGVDVWNDFHDRFHQSNGPRIFQIKQQLNGLSHGSNDDSGYFTKLKTLWVELREFRPVSACNCGGLKDLMEFQQQEYILQFLMGLNESYSQIRAQILMIDHLPPINKVFSLVIQEERQRSLSSYGHTINDCYKIHGYPPGFKFKWRNLEQNNGQSDQYKLVANQSDTGIVHSNNAATDVSISSFSSANVSSLLPFLVLKFKAVLTVSVTNNQQFLISLFSSECTAPSKRVYRLRTVKINIDASATFRGWGHQSV
ncbi:hypothetical protein LWI28_020507 [Acer negundo]|uniref:Retrotransposon Copia-like N-terminal domain-containing protein n=1 Tax=Acer negundo TaxID=4023 RepID=A0AAD5P2L2_ACENE|nr:hypothetical protein LWI28_020507 [Acer negundo]